MKVISHAVLEFKVDDDSQIDRDKAYISVHADLMQDNNCLATTRDCQAYTLMADPVEAVFVDNGKTIQISFTLDREISASKYDARAIAEYINDPRAAPVQRDWLIAGRSLLHHMIEREHKLRTAIKDAGFAVLEASNRWDIVDVTDKAKAQEEYELKKINEEIEKNRENHRANVELAKVLKNMAFVMNRAEKVAFDTYSNAQKLTWQEIEANCRSVYNDLLTSLENAQPLIDKHTAAQDD